MAVFLGRERKVVEQAPREAVAYKGGVCVCVLFFNPLSPSSDYYQIPPVNIKSETIREVSRIKDMITQDILTNSP